MKKLIIFSTFVSLLFVSCNSSDDNLFDQAASERIEAIWTETQEILLSAPNGWSMEFYYDETLSYGGRQLFFRFYEDQTVDITSELVSTDSYATSLYTYDQDSGATINFDTYNSVLHYFSEPLNDNVSYGGDFEFIIYEVTPEQITLVGKRTELKYVMTMLPSNVAESGLDTSYFADSNSDGEYSWTELMDGYLSFSSELSDAISDYTFYVDGMQYDTELESSGIRSYNRRLIYTDPFEGTEEVFPFIYTFTGIKFYEPLTFEGLTFQEMYWSGKMFIDDETGAILK